MPGAQYLFKPVVDQRSIVGRFEPDALERVLDNQTIQDVLKQGLILVYYDLESHGHAISIRKLNDCWYLYDPNKHEAINYFLNTYDLAGFLSAQTNCYTGLVLVSLEKEIVPNAELWEIINHDDRFWYNGLFDIFKLSKLNPIVSIDHVFRKERYDFLVAFGIYGEYELCKVNILHFVFIAQAGLKLIDFFKYAGKDLGVGLKKIDNNGYSAFMLLFLANSEAAEPVLDILSQYPDLLLENLVLQNSFNQTALHFISDRTPKLLRKIFHVLADHKEKLLALLNHPDKRGKTPKDFYLARVGNADELHTLMSN